ncbi:MAG TPA: multicopper oxidase family protein [Kiloniellales bacterium]|nr:multicopper oxidase family protein [Kiloniellales bacterium]
MPPLAVPRARAADEVHYRLVLREGEAQLLPQGPVTRIWGYDGQVPGPLLTAPQDATLVVEAENRLGVPTSVHWHGVRLPNAMDGVAGLTQPPILPGETFTYRFALPDAGTFWYHPHYDTGSQLGRGLYGPLIVTEKSPPVVDRDLLWVFGDWRLGDDGQVIDDFHDPFDQAHDGRVGDLVTLNGSAADSVAVRRNELLRLRLVNACAARVLALTFEGHRPWVLARDGQPTTPWELGAAPLLLGPGMRADLLLRCDGTAESLPVVDHYNPAHPAELLRLVYEGSIESIAPDGDLQLLRANPLALPDPARAERLEIVLAGGMMHGMGSSEAMHQGAALWTINGQAMAHEPGTIQAVEPLFRLSLGRSYHLVVRNDSDRWHPLHLHGMHMLLLAENGETVTGERWADSLLLAPRGSAEALLLADNPGRWMLHCHVLQHQESGMASVVDVA